jgi:hypothetical protein
MELPKDWRQQLQKVYPKRRGQGWVNAGKQIAKQLVSGESFEEMLIGADNYRRHCAVTGEFVRMAQTFFGPNMWWTEYLDDEDCINEVTIDDQARDVGLVRQDGESDDHLKRRIGVAQTEAMYRKNGTVR